MENMMVDIQGWRFTGFSAVVIFVVVIVLPLVSAGFVLGKRFGDRL